MTTRFDRDTAVILAGDGRFRARIDAGWSVIAPNGGYLAALVLRALALAVDDPARAPRSFTIHYTTPPEPGEAHGETRVERRGRSLTTVSGRLLQGDRLVALALAAFSAPREGYGFSAARMPEVAPPERCPRIEPRFEIHRRYEQRWAIGSLPFSGGPEARNGGWIRLAEARPLDAFAVAAYCDAFPPAVFSSAVEGAIRPGVPTIDLSIHFRSPLPLPGAAPDEFCLATFSSRLAHQGFLEEDGEIWSRDGVLLAHSRQLAILG
jgi:acyl-CoA thioesterase